MTKRRVLLTGAEGFTGHYLSRVLAQGGWMVHGFARPGTDLTQIEGGDDCLAVKAVDLCDERAIAAAVAAIACRPAPVSRSMRSRGPSTSHSRAVPALRGWRTKGPGRDTASPSSSWSSRGRP